MSQRAAMTTNGLNIVSYNVLSSHLGGADYFTSCDPKHLDPDARLATIKTQLAEKMSMNAVICLQEVSTTWAAQLHPFFAAKGYYFTCTHYGEKFNGYMGVGIAVPLNTYAIEQMDITCVANTKLVPRKPPLSLFHKLTSLFLSASVSLLRIFSLYKPTEDAWTTALRRRNQMLSLRLSSKSNGAVKFVVATYHMPCVFKVPQVMLIHSALSSQLITKFANGDPYIFAGDFNIKPSSSMYQLLTSGDINTDHPDYPSPELPFVATTDPLRSAYKECLGSEPDFTNNSRVKDEEAFIDTLDYIFVSKEWRVNGVGTLPTRSEVSGPLPDGDRPSDHLLIEANLSL